MIYLLDQLCTCKKKSKQLKKIFSSKIIPLFLHVYAGTSGQRKTPAHAHCVVFNANGLNLTKCTKGTVRLLFLFLVIVYMFVCFFKCTLFKYLSWKRLETCAHAQKHLSPWVTSFETTIFFYIYYYYSLTNSSN